MWGLDLSKNKDNPGVMTRGECSATMMPLQASLLRLENAIIGTDLSSGLVKKVSDLTAKVDSIAQTGILEKAEREKKEAKKDRWKIAALSFAGALLGIAVKVVIDKL